MSVLTGNWKINGDYRDIAKIEEGMKENFEQNAKSERQDNFPDNKFCYSYIFSLIIAIYLEVNYAVYINFYI